MSVAACRTALLNCEVYQRAASIDQCFPECACEAWSLCEAGGAPVGDDELIARVLTSPDAYEEDTATIVTGKLTSLYSLGLSVIREGAGDEEIITTINDLLDGAAEPKKLVGAIVVKAAMLRSYADPAQWFGVYATDDRNKSHHVDIFGTTPEGGSSKANRARKERRYTLADDLSSQIVFADDSATLVEKLRTAGI